jgi:hypothetical protein
MTEQEQNDYVAAKMGIIFLCENCRKRVHSISDKVGNVIGWIHTESEGVVCEKSATQASPASLQTLEDMFNPKPLKVKMIKARTNNKTHTINIDDDEYGSCFDKFSEDYTAFGHVYDSWNNK